MEATALQTVHYQEQGVYTMAGQQHEFYQHRVLLFDHSQLSILKSDGELLHEFTFGGDITFPLQLTHTHYCGEDVYNLTLDIINQDEFAMHYNIAGTYKNYAITTRFVREG